MKRFSTIYDNDLRRFRFCCGGACAANVVLLVVLVWVHEWFGAATCALWALNFCVALVGATAQQKTRDISRTAEAGLQAIQNEFDLKGEL